VLREAAGLSGVQGTTMLLYNTMSHMTLRRIRLTGWQYKAAQGMMCLLSLPSCTHLQQGPPPWKPGTPLQLPPPALLQSLLSYVVLVPQICRQAALGFRQCTDKHVHLARDMHSARHTTAGAKVSRGGGALDWRVRILAATGPTQVLCSDAVCAWEDVDRCPNPSWAAIMTAVCMMVVEVLVHVCVFTGRGDRNRQL
jgi:hypothetical protein